MAKMKFDSLKNLMSIDSLFKEYEDPNLILNDPGFIEFDRMLKVEEYKLLMLLRKIKDIERNTDSPIATELKEELSNLNVII